MIEITSAKSDKTSIFQQYCNVRSEFAGPNFPENCEILPWEFVPG